MQTGQNVGFLNWIEDNLLDCTEIDSQGVYQIGEHKFVWIVPKQGKLFSQTFSLLVSDFEQALYDHYQCKYFVFEFGGYVYYTDDTVTPKLTLLKYLGQGKVSGVAFLGVHDYYELLNGTKSPGDWIKKAKWAGYQYLAQVNRHTLSGTIDFVNHCTKNKIKPIVGMEVVVVDGSNATFAVKLYVCNEDGWRNLLKISNIINIDLDYDKTLA